MLLDIALFMNKWDVRADSKSGESWLLHSSLLYSLLACETGLGWDVEKSGPPLFSLEKIETSIRVAFQAYTDTMNTDTRDSARTSANIFNHYSTCRCCPRHMSNRPEYVTSCWVDTPDSSRTIADRKSDCGCECRHHLRALSKNYPRLPEWFKED